ncbi:MAG: LPS-assembly protein LptD [Bacteroidetes bacterium]|nr:MAG: LPS-assembly protein LptD [Bacteroidota bacterium]
MTKTKAALGISWQVVLFFTFSVFCFSAFGQQTTPASKPSSVDSLPPQPNERITTNNTILDADSSVVSDTVTVKKRGDIDTIVEYYAKDSIVMDRENEIVYLYGEAKIDYGDITIEAAKIIFDQKNNLLSAQGTTDSTGKDIGNPVLTESGMMYTTDGMQYHFGNRRALTTGLVTEQSQGYLHGEEVYKNENDELFVNHAKYTTCNLAHPHFEIRSRRLKRSGRNIISGPFNIYINDVPTPLGLPFGMFPDPETRSSGIIVPTYGEERQRGFFLRDGGYYFNLNDYWNLRLTGEIYSKGGWGSRVAANYRKRYAYNGRFNFNLTKRIDGFEGEDSETTDFSLTWSHSPVSKGNSRFSATVNAATSTYNQNNALSVQQNINANLNSSISYSKVFVGTPFNLTLSARHNQNLTTNIVDITLPEMSINMNRQTPFKRSKVGLLKNFSFSWTSNVRNRITNSPSQPGSSINIVNGGEFIQDTLAFNFENLPTLLEKAENGARHQIPLTTSAKIFKHFTIGPTVNFTELWYLKKLNYTYVPEENGVRIDTLDGFTRATTYTSGVSLSTRIYGTFQMKPGKKVQAIRHTIIPSLSFAYTPDFTDEKFDYFQDVQVDSLGNRQLLSRYHGFVFGSPTQGNSGSIGFSLQNTVEMKVKKSDTSSTTKKIHVLRNLGLSTSYNLIADSFNLANIRIVATTSILDNLIDFSAGFTIDPYIYELIDPIDENGTVKQRRVNEFAWNNGQGLGSLRSANFAFNTRLDPKTLRGEKSESNPVTPGSNNLDSNPNSLRRLNQEAQIQHVLDNPNQYIDFSIPWTLRLQYALRYSRIGFEDASITQSLTFSGDLSLSTKWKVTFNSGFDFQNKAFTQTRLGITRDLHCWNFNFNWVPFGRFQSYNVDIHVNASILNDLKLSKRRSFIDSGASFN